LQWSTTELVAPHPRDDFYRRQPAARNRWTSSKELIMQLTLRPCAIVGVAVLGAGLVYITPTTTPRIEQRAVELAAAEDLIDLVNPLDAGFSALIGAGGSALASVSDALPSAADLQLLDPAFWDMFWSALIDPNAGESPWLLLTGAIEELPVIGPALELFGVALFPVILVLAGIWAEISQALGIEPYAAAAEAVPAGVSTALDPSVLTSVLDLNPIADIGTVVDPAVLADIGTAIDPAAIADIGTVLSTSTIPDLGEVLTSLIP
jgi:hypothetical protein